MVPLPNLSTDCRRTRWTGLGLPLTRVTVISSGSGLGWILDAYWRGCIASRAAWRRAETVDAGEGC